MKKRVVLTLAVFLLLLLASCGKKPPVNTDATQTSAPPDSSAATVETTAPFSETTASSSVSVAEYDTVQRTLKSGALDCAYEVLTVGDPETDELLYSLADEMLAVYLPNASSLEREGGSAAYTAKLSDIYLDEKLISAAFCGEYSIFTEDGGESRGEVYYTVNIDREHDKLLSAGDIVADFDKMKAALTDGSFSGIPEVGLLSQYRPEYDIYPYVRFDADDFYVNITETGVTETNTEYSISRADASVFLAEAYR